jgi:hypothetical protein
VLGSIYQRLALANLPKGTHRNPKAFSPHWQPKLITIWSHSTQVQSVIPAGIHQ